MNNYFSLSSLPCGHRSNLLHTTQTKSVKLISSLGAPMSHLTIAYPEHPFYVGSPIFDQILWTRTWSAEMFLSKVIGGIWMLNYSRLQPGLFWELGHRTACGFTTDLISRCASPEALQIPKSLDGSLPLSESQGKHGRGIAFACPSWQLVGWRQEQLDGSCRWHF